MDARPLLPAICMHASNASQALPAPLPSLLLASHQFWLSTNHVKAIWRVLRSDTWVGRLLPASQLGFVVTKKVGNHPSHARRR